MEKYSRISEKYNENGYKKDVSEMQMGLKNRKIVKIQMCKIHNCTKYTFCNCTK